MRVTVNGLVEDYEVSALTVSGLMERKRWSFPLVIVSINERQIERSAYATTPLSDGDLVEIYHLVSGG